MSEVLEALEDLLRLYEITGDHVHLKGDALLVETDCIACKARKVLNEYL